MTPDLRDADARFDHDDVEIGPFILDLEPEDEATPQQEPS